MHPFLGAFCPILIVSDIRLEFIDPALCSSQLIRKFLSGLSCCLEVCLPIVSRAVNQLDNGIACPVHYIGCPVHYIGFRIFCFSDIRNSRYPSICNLANTSHRVPLTSTPRIFQHLNPSLILAYLTLWITRCGGCSREMRRGRGCMLTRRTEGGPLRHCRFPTPPDNVCPKPTFVWGRQGEAVGLDP